MARPRSTFRLFPCQFAALGAEEPEILVSSSVSGTPAGASHLLRAMAIRACAAKPGGASVLILQRQESDLYRDHVSGDSGILSMVREMQAAGFATVSNQNDEIAFGNGSILRWSGCARESEVTKVLDRRVDVLLVDQAQEVPESLFERLRETVLSSTHPARKIVAASRSGSEAGWVGQHWSTTGPESGRRVILLPPDDLDPELTRRPGFPSYREWLTTNFGADFIWAPHTPSIVNAIDRWIDDEFDHLAIFMPSQHGKTEAGPRHAVPYLLRRFPSDWCAIVSYNNEVANSRSADARDNYLRIGGELRPGRKKVKQWLTVAGGGCWSAGMGAGQTGHSNSWGFMDDPDQDWEDAVNGLKQAKKRRRYGSVFRARESMFAKGMRRQKLCATVTRWDPQDMIGFAMEQSHVALTENPTAHERWAILAISAVYDPAIQEGYRQLYPRFVVLDDYRSVPGEPIWPDRRTADDWKVVFVIRGPIIAACECQQNPKGVERGGQFEADWFVRLSRDIAFAAEAPNEAVYAACTRAWDLAATEGAGDWTAGAKLGRSEDGGDIIVRHVVRAQHAPRGVKQLIAATMIADGPTVKIRLPIDPAAGGEAAAEEIVRYLREVAGWVGMPVPEIVCKRPRKAATASQTAKAARAHDLRSRAQPPAVDMLGGVHFVAASWEPALSNVVDRWSDRVREHPELRELAKKAERFAGDWWTPWLQEMQSFTGDDGREDDQVDGTVDAYEEVYLEPPAPEASGAMYRLPGLY